MTKLLSTLDFHLLHYFSVAAEERSLRRAAERLFMTQPPLSRHIKRLEEILGVTLFIRHNKGLMLTDTGAQVLEKIRPLLALQAKTFQELDGFADALRKSCAVGFSTAFEQGVFARLEKALRKRCGNDVRIVRKTSPKLVRDVRRGRLAAAFVALPVEASDLITLPIRHEELLMAAVPASWPEAQLACLSLQDMNARPLFWFHREQNPAYFDHMQAVFSHIGFHPRYLDEPAEHDVLLARIASGEGMGLMPQSFAAIRRDGVVFAPVTEAQLLRIQAGCVCHDDDETWQDIATHTDF